MAVKKRPKDFKRYTVKPKQFALIKGKPIYEIGEFIDHAKFDEYRKNYKRNLKTTKPNCETIHAHLFGLGNILKLIGQPGCHGVRMYYGIEKRGKKLVPQLMLVGVYKDGNDMLDHTLILDASLPCPDYCDDDQ